MPKRIIQFSRRLRYRQTDAEKQLWRHIRNSQLGYKFRRQHPIHPYIVDFYSDELRLAIELDGGQHADSLDYDERRTAHLNSSNVEVLRYWNNDVLQNIEGVIDSLTPALTLRARELEQRRKQSSKSLKNTEQIPLSPWERAGVRVLNGDVIAYPTEAVYGLGCDPCNQAAVESLLKLKQRPIDKGLIIVAGELSQLAHWINVEAVTAAYPHVLDSWPGHSTWLLPCRPETPQWLTGQFDTLAVRISAHPDIQKLCAALGKGLVSTSANPAGQSPARSAQQTLEYFPHLHVLEGSVNESAQPSVIRDAQTQKIIRS